MKNKKISIVTVYEPTTNIGSYLQAYAMKILLESFGFDVTFIEKTSKTGIIKKHVLKLNPKRAFFLRLQQGLFSINALKKLKTVRIKDVQKNNFDLVLYGSDEIWNLQNPYFADELFFGGKIGNIPKIAFAVSAGAMSEKELNKNQEITKHLKNFESISVRDENTNYLIGNLLNRNLPFVCDPTFLVPLSTFNKPKFKFKQKYLLVYSYGINEEQQKLVIQFAREKGLKIVSAHFWHHWCDKNIAISPFDFNNIIENAEYVFTTTFHGAVFTMLNHKKCVIFPVREKVAYVTKQFGAEKHIINDKCDYENFKTIMEQEFDSDKFEGILNTVKKHSLEILKEGIKCVD